MHWVTGSLAGLLGARPGHFRWPDASGQRPRWPRRVRSRRVGPGGPAGWGLWLMAGEVVT
jgi:hypothetical protein